MKDFQKTKTSYEKPEFMILEFELDDIITTSGAALDKADISGGSEDFLNSWQGQ